MMYQQVFNANLECEDKLDGVFRLIDRGYGAVQPR